MGKKVFLARLAEFAASEGSQRQLALRIGAQPQNINSWVNGRRQMSIDNAKHILDYAHARGFEMNLCDLRPDLAWLQVSSDYRQ